MRYEIFKKKRADIGNGWDTEIKCDTGAQPS